MMIRGYELGARAVVLVLIGLMLFAALVFGLRQCELRRSQGAQSKVERSQADAASNSAADAINTVATAGTREAASEDLTRSNEKDIRNAEGANERVGAGVNTAGRRALCLRDAYRDRPECRVFRTPAS